MTKEECSVGTEVCLADKMKDQPKKMLVVGHVSEGITCQWFTTTGAICEHVFPVERLKVASSGGGTFVSKG